MDMWTTINETLSNLCSSALWDHSTWNSPNPYLTSCFKNTLLTWFPCAFLWTFLPLELYSVYHSKTRSISFNRYNTFKLVMIALLQATTVVNIVRCFLNDITLAVDIYTHVVQFLSFTLFSCLTYVNMKYGVLSSGVLLIFSFLLVLCGAPEFWTELQWRYKGLLMQESVQKKNDVRRQDVAEIGHFGVYGLYYVSVWLIFLLNCFPDSYPVVKVRSDENKPCPEKTSSFLSRIFFSWSDSFAWKGYKKPLSREDLWDLDDEMKTEQLIEKFESKWQLALNRLRRTRHVPDVRIYRDDEKSLEEEEEHYFLHMKSKLPGNPEAASILRPLCEIFGWHFWWGATILKLADSGLYFAQSLILNVILAFVDNESEVSWHGYFYVIIFLMISVLQSLLYNAYHHMMNRTGLQIRTALVAAIYKKALKISIKAKRDFSLGEILNLVSVDAQTFTLIVPYIPFLWISPIEICVAVFCLWNILGVSAFGGVAVMIILTILSFVFLQRIQKQRMKQMKHKDKRLQLTNEVLSGMKVLKLYACEPNFKREIIRIREKELMVLKDTVYLHAGSTFAWVCASFLLCFVTFGLYVLSNRENVLDARTIFVSLSLFCIMKWSLELMPWIVTRAIQANVAIKRISEFLNLEELDPNAVSHVPRREPIVIQNGEFSWQSDGGMPTLSDINVKVSAGDLVAIVGPVGSGKSSLLSALLGEMYKQSGYVNTTGKLAYVPQEAWIQSTTLRNNITFGDETKLPHYETILEVCALTADLEILTDGDQTEIGEKGANLSGGQKQRISLARAVFSDADIYLLDDPLSSVDAHVGKHIFEKVISSNGQLKKKTRVFVTHNVNYLPYVDRIIVLKNGTICETGTYRELLDKSGDSANFFSTYLKADEDDESRTGTTCSRSGILEELSNPDENLENLHESNCQAKNEYDEEDEAVERTPLTESEQISSDSNKGGRGNIYTYYIRAMGPLLMTAIILSNVLYQIFTVKANYWLSEWANIGKKSNTTDDEDRRIEQYKYLSVYALLGVGQAVSITAQTVVLFIGTLNAAKYVHDRLLNSVFRWPVVTFDRIPFGAILNRFGSDIDVLDGLSIDLLDLVTYAGFVTSTIFMISCNTPVFLSALLPIGVAYYFIQKIYSAVSKHLKRLESASKSPIYSHFGDTIAGAHSIRAYGLQTAFIRTCEKKINFNQKCSYASIITYRWFASRLGLIGHSIVFSAALFAVLARNTINAALVGLSINYAIQMIWDLYYFVVMTTGVRTSIVALERIKEYSDKEQEAPWAVPEVDNAVEENWPDKGEIVFKDFEMRYQEDLAPVLNALNFSIRGGEKVGVVGRTGAGKSSLTLSLFRIIEASGGCILIDGIDISKIGLHTLRSRLTIIPQNPVLFSGTLRMNLDPAARHSDESLWKTLEAVGLKNYIVDSNFGLQYAVEDGGSNFSAGQRQLMCLARVLLRKTKVLILDEATAAVDFETDDAIQGTIRKEFDSCTVLTIAHRLNTVLDYDRIMVLDRGCVAEFDSPASLLESKQSIFYTMAVDAGVV